MSILPLDIQRRSERRWAARLARPTEAVAPRTHRLERKSQHLAAADKPNEIQIQRAGSSAL
jgi:hypothetical protein